MSCQVTILTNTNHFSPSHARLSQIFCVSVLVARYPITVCCKFYSFNFRLGLFWYHKEIICNKETSQETGSHFGDFTRGGEWLLKNATIFFYSETDISLKINIDTKEPTCMYQLRFIRGPHDPFWGFSLVELV